MKDKSEITAKRFSVYMTRPAYDAIKLAMAESGMSKSRQIETWLRESPEAKTYLSRTMAKSHRKGDDIW